MNTKINNASVVLNTTDDFGNVISYTPHNGKITLKINGAVKNLGLLVFNGEKLTYVKQEDPSHIHRKSASWSVNRKIASVVDEVRYITDDVVYTIDSGTMRNVSMSFPWDSTGVDSKFFYPLRAWDITGVNPTVTFYINALGVEWYLLLKDYLDSGKLNETAAKVTARRKAGIDVYPESDNVFRAFRMVQPSQVKVVIIGQDPYHTPGVADGLAFSCQVGITPPSLRNIFNEIENELDGELLLNTSPNLTRWAEQGVFLLNTYLTVERGQALSHTGFGWDDFTKHVVSVLSSSSEGIVFMLWGQHAQSTFGSFIDVKKHLVLTAAHPSPFSANNGFFGCNHFKEANSYIESRGGKKIFW